uniref:Uncharacterized protein n=1 Tax=Spongospora subterranea TaxID=70186 RepID=A0A0H5R289_9EUKA|eukprot:CRZ01994.1 hypothetical protein [Spongospora subterranea]
MSASDSHRVPELGDGRDQEMVPVQDVEKGDSVSQAKGTGFTSIVTIIAERALHVMELIGETLADLFGITTPRYQFVIDAYQRHIDEIAEEDSMIEMGIERQRQREFDEERQSSHSRIVEVDDAVKLEKRLSYSANIDVKETKKEDDEKISLSIKSDHSQVLEDVPL